MIILHLLQILNCKSLIANLFIDDVPLESFLQACDLTSLIKETACFQSSCNPGCIDFILTNQKTCILSNTFEARLFDHQKLIVTVTESGSFKGRP